MERGKIIDCTLGALPSAPPRCSGIDLIPTLYMNSLHASDLRGRQVCLEPHDRSLCVIPTMMGIYEL